MKKPDIETLEAAAKNAIGSSIKPVEHLVLNVDAEKTLELIRYVQIMEKAFDDAMDDARLNSWGTTEHPWDRTGYMEIAERELFPEAPPTKDKE